MHKGFNLGTEYGKGKWFFCGLFGVGNWHWLAPTKEYSERAHEFSHKAYLWCRMLLLINQVNAAGYEEKNLDCYETIKKLLIFYLGTCNS